MRDDKPRLGCRFYRTDSGEEPVRDWIRGLGRELAKEIGSDIQDVQWRWPVGPPLVGSFGGGLYEVRTQSRGRIFRVLFGIEENSMVLLHGFEKKTQRTRKGDIEMARRRMR